MAPIIPAMRKKVSAVLVAVLSASVLTCGGGGGERNSVTDPSLCSPALAGAWTWTVSPPCGITYGGNTNATYDAATCSISLNVTTDEQRGRGLSQILRMNFSTMTATVTQNAAPCASTDQGRIIRDPNSYRITLNRAANGNCCAGPWAINVIHGD